MKDTHNVILIIVSSKWSSFFFPELFIMSHFSVRDASSFLFRSLKFSAVSHRETPSKSSQGFTLYSQLLFLCYHPLILLPEFSRRLNMVVRQGFFSFFNCSSRFLLKLRSTKLYAKINMVLNTCFFSEEFKYSSSCMSKCYSFYENK